MLTHDGMTIANRGRIANQNCALTRARSRLVEFFVVMPPDNAVGEKKNNQKQQTQGNQQHFQGTVSMHRMVQGCCCQGHHGDKQCQQSQRHQQYLEFIPF